MLNSALGSEDTARLSFEDFPAEIRNEIYKYLLITPLTTIEIGPYSRSPRNKGYQDVIRALSHLQSLKVNKAVYSEASSLFYGSKEFQFYLENDIHPLGAFFLKMTPSSRLSIRKLDLHLNLEGVESSTWVETCLYLAEHMALCELKLSVYVCGRWPCQSECPSKASDINAPWATALTRIQSLSYFSIHTTACGGMCGFGKDGIFAEDNVVLKEVDRNAERKEKRRCRSSCSEQMGPCGCYRHWECDYECFTRDFVEGLRERMGLRTGKRFVHVLTGEHVGCYKDVDPKDVVVPAAGRVVGLSSYCRELDKHAGGDSNAYRFPGMEPLRREQRPLRLTAFWPNVEEDTFSDADHGPSHPSWSRYARGADSSTPLG